MALTKATLIDLNSNELILDLDADTSITADTDDTIHIKIAGSDELTLTSTAIAPSTSDGQALGTSSLMFSDLFLASGSVLNFNNGDVTLTHASNLLTLDGGSLDLDGEALILDADGDTKLVESSDDVIHLTFAGSTSTPTEFGAGYMNLKNQGTRSYIRFYCESSNAHYTELRAAAHADYSGNVQVTLPATAGTLATLAGTETFTNKTLTSPNIGTSIELLARAEARFQDASGGQFVALEAPATVSSSFVLTLPAADGSSGQFLKTDGSGALSFDTVSSAADDLTAGDAAISLTTTAGNITIDAQGSDTDIIFKGTDDSSDTTFLTLDGSDAGTAIFNHDIKIADDGQIGSASAADAMIISSGGIVTFKDDILIKDGGTIGSASDADAITIGSDGDVTFTQDLELQHDGATLSFGANDEIALTHVHDTGLLLTDSGGTPTLQLHDANESIASDGSKVIITSGGTAFSLPTADGSNTQVIQTNGSGVLSFADAGGGKIGQVIQTNKTDVFSTTSSSFVDVTGFSASITPSASSSKVLVIVNMSTSSSDNSIAARLYRGSTLIGAGDGSGSRSRTNSGSSAYHSTLGNTNMMVQNITYLDSPNTTSSTTYKIQGAAVGGGTLYYGRTVDDTDNAQFARTANSITLLEVLA